MSTVILILAILFYICLAVFALQKAKIFLATGSVLNFIGILWVAKNVAWNSPLVGLGSISLAVSLIVLGSQYQPKMSAMLKPGAAIAALLSRQKP